MAISFYNAGDNAIYDSGMSYVPQERYRSGYTAPVQGGGQDASTPSFGIPNTNAFANSGGGGDINHNNSFLPDPKMTYMDMAKKYGADSPQAQQMLEKAGGTYPGGFQSNEGGFEYTNSFPDNSIQMENLSNNYLNQGNTFQGKQFNANIQDEKDMIAELAAQDANTKNIGFTYPNDNRFSTYDGIRNNIMSSPGVRTINGDLSKIANPEIFNNMSKSPQVGDKGFENYSESAFEEEEDKKGFIANMISRAKQAGSNLPGWATSAAKGLGLGSLIGGPVGMALGFLKGGKNYEQFDPRGSFKGGVYTMDGVNYANPGQANEFYDNDPSSPTYGTNRFDRA